MMLAQADYWFPRYRNALFAEYQRQTREFASRVRSGEKQPTTLGDRERWARNLAAIKKPFMLGLAELGYRLAIDSFQPRIGGGLVARTETPSGKARTDVPEDISDADFSFVLRHRPQNIEAWLAATSKREAKEHARILDTIFNTAAAAWNEETQRGLTTREIAKQIERAGTFKDRWKAVQIARTGTIWAANEGIHQYYQDSGVQVEEWLATADDLTCEYCMSLDGKRVATRDSFVSAGQSVWVDAEKDGRMKRQYLSRDMPFNIEHPPLHPSCRCTLIPVI
jgi:hypothetical protein